MIFIAIKEKTDDGTSKALENASNILSIIDSIISIASTLLPLILARREEPGEITEGDTKITEDDITDELIRRNYGIISDYLSMIGSRVANLESAVSQWSGNLGDVSNTFQNYLTTVAFNTFTSNLPTNYCTANRALTIESNVTNLQTATASNTQNIAQCALKTEIPSLTNYALKSDIPSLTNYALKTEVPSVSGLLSETAAANTYATKSNLTTLERLFSSHLEEDLTKNYTSIKFIMDLMYPVNSIFISVEYQTVVYNGSTYYIAPQRESYWWGEFVSSHPNHPLVFGTWNLIPNSNAISSIKAGFMAVAAVPTMWRDFSKSNNDYVVSLAEIGNTDGRNDLTVQNLPEHAHKGLMGNSGVSDFAAQQRYAGNGGWNRWSGGDNIIGISDPRYFSGDEIGSLLNRNNFITRGDQIDINPVHYNCFIYKKISLD